MFDIPKRRTKKEDMSLIKKSYSSPKQTTTTVKGGGSLLDKIKLVIMNVERFLGHLKDEHILIRNEEDLIRYMDKVLENGVISTDTETTGLNPMLDDIAGICIYTPGEKGAYIPINHIDYITQIKIKNQLSIDFIRNQFERIKDIDVIMFNANFDIRVLKHKIGWKDAYCTWDCYIAAKLLNENEPSNALKKLHQKYVLKGKEDAFKFDELFKDIPFTMIPLKTAVLYAGHDPVITYELYEYQKKYLREDNEREDMRNLYWVFNNIEMPCIDAIVNMEDNGIKLDLEYQQKLSVKYHKLLDDKLKEIYTEIDKYKDKIDKYKKGNHKLYLHPDSTVDKNNIKGYSKVIKECKLDDPINISSPTQLAVLFYDILKVGEIDKKTPRGTGEDILKQLDIPLAKLILEYRGLEKLISTYIDKLPECVNPNDGRIHCTFNQYGAKTGRMSSSDPKQNWAIA